MGKHLDSLRRNKLEFNQSEQTECHLLLCSDYLQNKKLDIPTPTYPQNPQNLPAHAQAQSDARQLAREVTAARRGQWLTPQPELLAVWREFEAHFGQTITSRQIGAIARLVDTNIEAINNELLQQIGAYLRQLELLSIVPDAVKA
jgi:hypothetical protein